MLKNHFNIVFVVIALIVVIFSTDSVAQYAGFKPVADKEAFKQKFTAESAKILSVSSNFTQEKILTALTEKITSEG